MADEPKKGSIVTVVGPFGDEFQVELREGHSVSEVKGPDGNPMQIIAPDGGVNIFQSLLRHAELSGDGNTVHIRLPPTIEGEATHIAGELPAPEGEGDG